MVRFIVGSIVVLWILWAISFLILWISDIRIVRMIETLEEAVDYILLKTDLPGKDPEKEKEIRDKMEIIKERIRKDFDV